MHTYHEIFENIQEGILLFSNNKIEFTNSMFQTILKSINVINELRTSVKDEILLDLKIFKLYRGQDMIGKSSDEI